MSQCMEWSATTTKILPYKFHQIGQVGKRAVISRIAAQSTIQIGMPEILFTAIAHSSERLSEA